MARLSLLFVAIAALLGCLAAPVAGQAFVTIIGYGTPNCTGTVIGFGTGLFPNATNCSDPNVLPFITGGRCQTGSLPGTSNTTTCSNTAPSNITVPSGASGDYVLGTLYEGSSCNRSAWGSQQAVRSGLCTPTDLAPGAFTLSNCNGTDGLITVFSDSNCSTPLPVVPPISVGSGCTNVLGLFSITGGCLKINSTVITTTTTRPASAGRVGVGAMGALAAAVVGMITLF